MNMDANDLLAEAHSQINGLKAQVTELTEVMHWAQATLTALNVGDVKSGSPLHLKLREVMIAYRAATQTPNDQALRGRDSERRIETITRTRPSQQQLVRTPSNSKNVSTNLFCACDSMGCDDQTAQNAR